MRKLILLVWVGFITAQRPSLMEQGFRPFDSNPYLTPSAMPESSVYVNWNTTARESTIIAYGLTPLLEDTLMNEGICYHHHLLIPRLTPKTEYYYRILPYGETMRFRTFSADGDSFRFVVFGDTRSDSIKHHEVISRIAGYRFDLMVHTGDLVREGDNTADWRTFFNIEDTLIQGKQILPVLGNHESPYWPFDTLFALPGNAYYYSINHGRAHFVILDTYHDINGSQRSWLIDDLDAAHFDSTVDWIFVFLHSPPYSSGDHGSDLAVRDAWCPIFEDHGVDIVFCGHDHDYERTVQINGVVYIVTGGGGAPLYEVGKSPWTAVARKVNHFCYVEVLGDILNMKAISIDGAVFDSLTIDKTSR
jgi:predicted phosphodiesterase